MSPNHDHSGWSSEERAIADYLRTNTSHTVDPGGRTPSGRFYDFTLAVLTNPRAADGKSPGPVANSSTMRNRARDSIKDGGQAPCLVFDARGTNLNHSEARRGVRRIAGLYGARGIFPCKLNLIIVIGDGFYLEEAI